MQLNGPACSEARVKKLLEKVTGVVPDHLVDGTLADAAGVGRWLVLNLFTRWV
jgi:hypothetical protein